MDVNWNTPKGTIVDGYDATPPSVNLKCIVFTVLVTLFYWFLTNTEFKYYLIPLFIVIIGLYDYFFNCNINIPRNILLGVVFSSILILLPQKNKWVFAICLYLPYIILAIYDYNFNCTRNKFGPTFLANFYAWAKPLHSDQIEIYKKWHPKWLSLIRNVDLVILLVILLLTPAFLKWDPK
jgi:hypothetical protein